jgi:hypothetical protein
METIQIERPEGKKIVKTITNNGIIITFEDINPNEVIDNKIKELEKQIEELKEQRQLTPAKKFILDKISGARPTAPDVNGRVSWNDKDGEWLYIRDFKNGAIWVNYRYIWSVLEEEYNLKCGEIQ